MTSPARGAKRRCTECGTAFYDMLRYPIRCPKCDAELDVTAGKRLVSSPRPPRNRTARIGRPAVAKVPPSDAELDRQAAAREESEADDEDQEIGDENDTEADDGDDDATADQ
jgi:hypothetical protein